MGRVLCWFRAARLRILATGLFVGWGLSTPARAFKWHECPAPPLPVYPSTIGAVNSPFVHPGHDLTIVLNQDEAARSGGFSPILNDNRIAIRFVPIAGPPISLAARTPSAVSPSALTFSFPDTQSEVERLLTGPVQVQVSVNGTTIASIEASDLVALPPATDVTEILLGQYPQRVVWAALGADGDLWVPTSFRSIGDPMPMPGCIGNFVHPLPVYIGGATIVGDVVGKTNPLSNIRGIEGYLGDIVVNDVSFYGLLYPQRINLVHVGDTLGVAVCRLNDAMELVLRVRGDQSWAFPKTSPFRRVIADATPIALQLTGARLNPGLERAQQLANDQAGLSDESDPGDDSFGNQCPTLGHD